MSRHHGSGSEYSSDELEDEAALETARIRVEERASLTAHRSAREREREELGLTSLTGHPNAPASIAANAAAFAPVGSSHAPSREGAELEDDDEEIEIDSDLEAELPQDEASVQVESEAPQKCSNWCLLYCLGLVTVIGCEFLILLPAFYVRLFVIGLLYGIIWLSLVICAAQMTVCPGKRKPHSTLALALYGAAFAAYIGGMVGAYYFKQAWYFDRADSAYMNVDAHVDPTTGYDWSGPNVPTSATTTTILSSPTFLQFQLVTGTTSATTVATYVYKTFPTTNATAVGVYVAPDGHTYCASAVTDTSETQSWDSDKGMPMTFYWAVSKDCCGKPNNGVTSIWANCKYWGWNVPGYTTTVTDFSAEVLSDSSLPYYRAAVTDFMSTTDLTPAHNSANSLLVEVMTLQDHYHRQYVRRLKAYIALGSCAVAWPLVLALFFLALWIAKKLWNWKQWTCWQSEWWWCGCCPCCRNRNRRQQMDTEVEDPRDE